MVAAVVKVVGFGLPCSPCECDTCAATVPFPFHGGAVNDALPRQRTGRGLSYALQRVGVSNGFARYHACPLPESFGARLTA